MPNNRNLNQRIRQSLYRLKREYGAGPLAVYKFGGSTVDHETQTKTITKTVVLIDRVIVLPARVQREVIQTISSISANKQFVYGGSYDSRARTFIIDRRDAPALILEDGDWFVFNNRKYELKSIQEFEFDTAWVVIGRELVGETPEQIHPLYVDHLLDLQSVASGGV